MRRNSTETLASPTKRTSRFKAAWLEIYADPDTHFELYELAEKLVDIEDAFQNWRFKHMYTVQRIIGGRPGNRWVVGCAVPEESDRHQLFPRAIRTPRGVIGGRTVVPG